MSTQAASEDVRAGPLAGLRVIDWTHVLAGPFSAYQLALLGADVIRIERADRADMIRAKAHDPALAAAGLGEAFVAQGSGKRSLAVDARDERVQAALRTLIGGADVLVENFRPGKLARLGFDPADWIERCPNLVVCSITGWGQESPNRAYDHAVQAASGMMVANAGPDGAPRRIGWPVVDYAVGQQAALAICAALLRRAAEQAAGRRQRGEWLQVSMLGAAVALLAPAYAVPLVSGIEPPRSASTAFSGSALSGTFACAQGHLAVVCNQAEQGVALVQALAAAGAAEADCAALRAAAQAQDVAAAQALLGRLMAARPAADWAPLLQAAGVPAAVVRTPAQAAAALSDRWPQVELALPAGPRMQAVPGIGFASSEQLTPAPLRAPPRRGQHTRELLAEGGLDVATIEALIAEGRAHAG